MATLGALKARIVLETNRDDLDAGGEAESALAGAIERAIEHHADEAFWFNRGSASAATVASVNTIALPDAVRIAEHVSHQGQPLIKTPLAAIADRGESGCPTHWAELGDSIQLWPVPDAAYALRIAGVARIAAPATDGDSNAWTNEAQDLIAARVRFLLGRDLFRDGEAVQQAAQAEYEALSRLRRETRRRGASPLRSGDAPWTHGGTV